MTTYNKAELAKDFGCSSRTIHNIAKACGLNTKRSQYTQEEVDKYLRPARTLLKKGKTYKEIGKMFNARDAKKNVTPYTRVVKSETDAKTPRTPIEDMINLPKNEGFLDENQLGIALYVQTVVQKHVRNIIPYLPLMTKAALENEYEQGNIEVAYEQMCEQFLAGDNPLETRMLGGTEEKDDDWWNDDENVELDQDSEAIDTDAQEIQEEE